MTATATTTPDVLARAARDRADHTAIVDGATTLTTAALAEQVALAARALASSGVGPGDTVAIWAPNSARWIVAALAIHARGAALVPINTRYKGDEAAHLLLRSRARVLFTVEGFLGARYTTMLRDTGVALPDLTTLVVDGDPVADPMALTWDAFLARAAHTSPADALATARAVTPDDLCDVMFTSGTTGHPKGVLCTHGATTRAFADWGTLVGLRPDDRYLVVVPFFHSFGYKAGWLAALTAGAVIYPQPVFDVDAVLHRIARDRITVLPGPPTLYQSLLAHPGRAAADLSSLRLAVTGAAVVPVELVHRMRRDLGFATVLTGYGLTESTGVATLCRDGDDDETVASTSGRAMPGVEVAVIDGDGQPLPTGAPGEVVVRGYNVLRGYLDDPDATASSITADGWLHTGDVGILDARGNLKITDRIKDMFIVGGFNCLPGRDRERRCSAVGSSRRRRCWACRTSAWAKSACAFVVPAPRHRALARRKRDRLEPRQHRELVLQRMSSMTPLRSTRPWCSVQASRARLHQPACRPARLVVPAASPRPPAHQRAVQRRAPCSP